MPGLRLIPNPIPKSRFRIPAQPLTVSKVAGVVGEALSSVLIFLFPLVRGRLTANLQLSVSWVYPEIPEFPHFPPISDRAKAVPALAVGLPLNKGNVLRSGNKIEKVLEQVSSHCPSLVHPRAKVAIDGIPVATHRFLQEPPQWVEVFPEILAVPDFRSSGLHSGGIVSVRQVEVHYPVFIDNLLQFDLISAHAEYFEVLTPTPLPGASSVAPTNSVGIDQLLRSESHGLSFVRPGKMVPATDVLVLLLLSVGESSCASAPHSGRTTCSEMRLPHSRPRSLSRVKLLFLLHVNSLAA